MKTIAIVAFVLVVAYYGRKLIRKGKELYQKSEDADLLVYELADLDFPKLTVAKLIEFSKIRTEQDEKAPKLHIVVTERVINPSKSMFTVDEMDISILTQAGSTVVQQVGKLKKAFEIKPNSSDNLVELHFLLDGKGVKELINESGGEEQIATNYLFTGNYGITFQMVGSIAVEGIPLKLPLDETITI